MPRKIVIAGASGFLGSALVESLTRRGDDVKRLVRRTPSIPDGEIAWDPARGLLDGKMLSGADAVLCFSGANVAGGRWTEKRKKLLTTSRVESISLLSETIAAMDGRPDILICASAIGLYGSDRGDAVLDEESPAGDDFLARLVQAWEGAVTPAVECGVRVVCVRFGLVLGKGGGALKKMLLPFKLGLGGVIGDGTQYMGWISLTDAVGVIECALSIPTLSGPINAVSPHPVTNREFTKALGRALRKPTLFPLPSLVVRALFGEMGDALLLGGARVHPKRLEEMGFSFQHPNIDDALGHIL